MKNGQTINDNKGVEGIDINALSAWELANGNSVLIGVLDSGIDFNNSELMPNIYQNSREIINNIDDDNNGYIDDISGWNFADGNNKVFQSAIEDKHGTNVAGIIAAADNGDGIIGVAPKTKILPLKFIKGNIGYTSDIIDAIEYAESMGVQIMNCSWGCSEYNFVLKNVIENSNMLFVCAAGNDGKGQSAYPAAFGLPNIISVGAIDNRGNITDYSNSGTGQDIYAPGSNILTTDCGNTYTTVSGTSFSAAYVSGIGALVKQAVPLITTDELKIAIRDGYSSHDNKKISDAMDAIKVALPLNFIKDEDSRLSRAMVYADKLITSDVAEILTKYKEWAELGDNEKNIINTFFGITDSDMITCAAQNLDTIDSIIVELAAKRVDLSTDIILTLINSYEDDDTFDNELDGLKNLYDRIQLTDIGKNQVITLMQNGSKVIDITKTLIISELLNLPVSDLINSNKIVYDYDKYHLSDEEKDSFIDLANTYNLNVNYLYSYIATNNILPSKLSQDAYQWQQDNNFFIVDNKVSPFSTSEPNLPGFNKYIVSNSGKWSYGSASIDKATGLLTYTQPLISLSGRNNLNLNLAMRFDSEVCDALVAANDSDRIAYAYMVNENDQYYTMSGTRYSAYDTTNNYYYNDDSTIASWQAVDSTVKNYVTINGTQYYYHRYINITAKTNSSIDASGLSNYYDSRYNMGAGWAFDLPSIEFINTIKYLHLPGGAKYKILRNNKLDGYSLNNINFGTATGTDFTVNGVAAAYSLSDLSSTKIYFDANGRYLGVKDIIGNKIQVYYDANGLIDRIYDTANRYIDVNYITNAGVSRTVTVTLVENDASQSKLLYTINETYYSTLESIAINTYLLTSITDAVGRTTSFDYSAYNSYVHFNSRSSYGTPTQSDRINRSIYLHGITSPSSSYLQIDYNTIHMAYGPASTRDYKRAEAIHLSQNKDDFNWRNYTGYYYANNNTYWRFQTNKIWPLLNTTANNFSIHGDEKQVTQINNQLRATSETTYQNSTGYAVSQNSVVSIDSHGLPTEIQQKTYQFNPGSSVYSTSTYTINKAIYGWDTNGYAQQTSYRTQSGECENGVISMNSYNDTQNYFYYNNNISYTVPTTITQYTTYDATGLLDEVNHNNYRYAVIVSNTIDSATKKIHEITKKVNNMSYYENLRNLSYSHYEYYNNGNVKEVITKYAKGNDSLDLTTFENAAVNDVEYFYDTKYAIYPVTTVLKNVVDCDGNPLKKADGTTAINITNSATYTMFGQIATSTDGNGYTTSYQYDDAGNITDATYPDSSNLHNTYNYSNRYVTTTNPDGTGNKTTYNIYGSVENTYRLNSDGISYNQLSKKTYDTYLRVYAETNYLNTAKTLYNATTYTYDFLSRVTDTTVRDQNNNLVGQTGNSYAQGISKVSSITNSVKTTVTTGTSKNYVATEYSDALGRTLYTDIKHGSGSAEFYTDTYTYSDYNNLAMMSGDTISSVDYYNNEAGDSKKDDYGLNPSDENVSYLKDYDGLGQQIYSTDANGNTTNNYYDILGRVVKTETPFDTYNNQTVYTRKKIYYDAGGRVIEEKQQNNELGSAESYSIKKYSYDNMNRVVKIEEVIDATHSTFIQYYYDSLGRLVRVYSNLSDDLTINGLDNVVENGDYGYSVKRYSYDFYGRLIKYTDCISQDETYQYYDLTDRLNVKTLRNGNTFTYTYDNAGNVIQVVGAQTGKTTITLNYTYDKAGNMLTAGDGTNSITYTYDNMGRCLSETDVYDGTTYIKNYEYLNGKNDYCMEVRKVSGGTPYLEFRQRYDYWNGLLSSVSFYGGDTYNLIGDRDYDVSYLYDANGNLEQKHIITAGTPTGSQSYIETYTYNKGNCVTSAEAWQNYISFNGLYWTDNFTQQFEDTAQYRLDGNKISKTTNYSDGLTEQRNYIYDDIGRLTSELYEVNDIRKWSKSYAFDIHPYWVENKITYTDYNNNNNSSITTNTYDPNNNLTDSETKDLNNKTTHYINLYYDGAGNVAEKIDHLTGESVYYSYDALNRMSSCTIPTIIGDMTTTFQYDAVGQRFKKQNGNQVTISLWEKGKIIEDIKTTGSMISKNMYVQGLFTEGVVKPETNEYGYQEYGDFYINSFDTNNDVITTWLINTDTNPSNYSYDAYGNGVNFLPSPYGYNGYYRDSETGLYYLNARYYDPTTQQFTQEDTYWGDGTDLYAYCHFNPVMYSDPSGHISMSEIAELWAKDYAMEAANAQWAIDNYGISSCIGKSAESYIQNYIDSYYVYNKQNISRQQYEFEVRMSLRNEVVQNKPFSSIYPYYGLGPRTGNAAENWYSNLLSTYDYTLRNETEFIFNYDQLDSFGWQLSEISLKEYTLAQRKSVMKDTINLALTAAGHIPYVGAALGYINDFATVNNLGSASASLYNLRAAIDVMSHDNIGKPIKNATYIVRFLQQSPNGGYQIKITSSEFYKQIFTVSKSTFDAAKYASAAFANKTNVYKVAPQYSYYTEIIAEQMNY